ICVRRGRRGVVRMWAGFVGARSASLGPDLLDKLSALGLEVAELPTGGVGPGLVVFDEASDIVCELVSEASRRGEERVIAVAAESGAVPPAASWRLVGAGAADVLVWDESG